MWKENNWTVIFPKYMMERSNEVGNHRKYKKLNIERCIMSKVNLLASEFYLPQVDLNYVVNLALKSRTNFLLAWSLWKTKPLVGQWQRSVLSRDSHQENSFLHYKLQKLWMCAWKFVMFWLTVGGIETIF